MNIQILLSLGLVLIPLSVSANKAKIKEHNQESLRDIALDIRDGHHSSAKRRQLLQFVQDKMKVRLAKDVGVKTAELNQHFLSNNKNSSILWNSQWSQLQTEFYTTLHQETMNEKWLVMQKQRKFTEYGTNLMNSMLTHLGTYVPSKEGLAYGRWQNMSVQRNGKTENHRLPFFLFSNKVTDLLKIDAHAGYEALFPKPENESALNPSLNKFVRYSGLKKREDLQRLAEIVQLNHRIYQRALANSAKTVASVYYLTGEYSLTEAEKKVGSFIDRFCEGCSVSTKDDYLAGAMTYVKNKQKEMRVYKGGRDVVSSFCMDLNASGYNFFEEVEEKPAYDPRDRTIVARDNTRVDMSHVRASMLSARLNALRKTIYDHDLGVLFLTTKLSLMNTQKNEPLGTRLSCKSEHLTADASLVRGAIEEARQNVESYLQRVNEKVRGSIYRTGDAIEALEYFTQTNVSATSEAVMTFPQGLNHLMKSVLELDKDTKRRRRMDKAVAWGGTIIGVGLTLTGIGAPEGVAILLAVGAMTKGVIAGSYHLYRSQQEKAFFRELSTAKLGLGTNFYLDGNMNKHYEEYRDMRTQYLVDFAGAIFSFAKIHKFAIGKAQSVPKAHGMIKGTMQKLKETGNDYAQDELASMILGRI